MTLIAVAAARRAGPRLLRRAGARRPAGTLPKTGRERGRPTPVCAPQSTRPRRRPTTGSTRAASPGQDIARSRRQRRDAGREPGRAARRMSLVAQPRPSEGAFARRRGLQLRPRLPGQVRLRRQLQRLRRLRHQQAGAARACHPGAVPGLAERRLGARRPAGPEHRLVAAPTTPAPARSSRPTDEDAWEGIKVFDISDPAAPRYVASVETDCGSHTHTLAPNDRRPAAVRLRLVVQARTRRSPTASRRTTRSASCRSRLRRPTARRLVGHAGAVPGRRQPGQRTRHQRLPRHHRLPEQGHRRRRLHG